MVPTWKTKKGKTLKFVEAGGYNRNEREREREIWQLGVGRQGGYSQQRSEFSEISHRVKKKKHESNSIRKVPDQTSSMD